MTASHLEPTHRALAAVVRDRFEPRSSAEIHSSLTTLARIVRDLNAAVRLVQGGVAGIPVAPCALVTTDGVSNVSRLRSNAIEQLDAAVNALLVAEIELTRARGEVSHLHSDGTRLR